MTCSKCGRKLIPAPSWRDGEETTCGYRDCKCSLWAYLNERHCEEEYEEYLERINREHPITKA